MIQVNINEAKTHFLKFVEKAMTGEDVVIMKDDEPVVKLVQISNLSQSRRLGTAKGQIKIASDFDEPISDTKSFGE